MSLAPDRTAATDCQFKRGGCCKHLAALVILEELSGICKQGIPQKE